MVIEGLLSRNILRVLPLLLVVRGPHGGDLKLKSPAIIVGSDWISRKSSGSSYIYGSTASLSCAPVISIDLIVMYIEIFGGL